MNIQHYLHKQSKKIDKALDGYLPKKNDYPPTLHEAMRYSVFSGGKRIRPILVLAACAAAGGDERKVIPAACAIELIHSYSLIHDDMPCMDDDALRRGKPTVHVAYDEATALLVGDALQSQAFTILSEGAAIAPGRQMAMIRLLAQASGSSGMCGGQAIDLDSVGLSLSLQQLEQMHQLKTGALLRAAVILGALAGKDLEPADMTALDAYAKAVGLAFQVVDDVLDATADSATLGKTAGKDAAANKPTYVSILGLEPSKALAEQLRCDAHAALAPFGDKARRLRELADLVVQRKA